MAFLITAMSHYSCTRCGRTKATMSTQKQLNMKCCQGDSLIIHNRMNPEDLQTAVKRAEVEIIPPAPLPVDTQFNAIPAPRVENPSNQPINQTIRASGDVITNPVLGTALVNSTKEVPIQAPANNPPVNPVVVPKAPTP